MFTVPLPPGANSIAVKYIISYHTGLDRSIGFQEVAAPRFQDNRHMEVVRLSALRTDRLYPPGIIPGTHFCYRLSQPQGHSAGGRIMWMKNSSDTIGNWTRNLPACSTVPQPTAPPRSDRWVVIEKWKYETLIIKYIFKLLDILRKAN
jgi:hypothetical protein